MVKQQSITKTERENPSNLEIKRTKLMIIRLLIVDALMILIKSARLVYRHMPRYRSNKEKQTTLVINTKGSICINADKFCLEMSKSNRTRWAANNDPVMRIISIIRIIKKFL